MPETKKLYASVIRLLIQLIVLVIVNWLLTALPMVKAISIPGLPVSITSIISFVIGLIAIIIILVFRRDFVAALQAKYPNFPQAAVIVSEAITLLIIVIAYASFEGSVKPLMLQLSWLYPVIFLALALWPLYMLITTLYRSSGPVAEWASTKIGQRPTAGMEEVKCPACGKFSPASAKYCTNCGVAAGTVLCSNKCTSCGAFNRQQDKYCLDCGALLDKNDQYDTRVSVD
jgi:hypothetical protein